MTYTPLVTEVRQSDYGYWLVTISVEPGKRMTVMMCQLGISPEQASRQALGAALPALTPKGA